MTDLLTLMSERCSVRKFKPDAIAPETLARILEAGRLAPTACNNQAVHIYVLESKDARAAVAGLTRYTFDAPAILLVCADTARTWKNPLENGVTSGEQDAAIVACHMMLEAWANGIGSCWVGYFPPGKLAAALALPEDHRPVLLMPIGVPADDAQPSALHSQRRALDDLVTRR